jgi:hypothetical protein
MFTSFRAPAAIFEMKRPRFRDGESFSPPMLPIWLEYVPELILGYKMEAPNNRIVYGLISENGAELPVPTMSLFSYPRHSKKHSSASGQGEHSRKGLVPPPQ